MGHAGAARILIVRDVKLLGLGERVFGRKGNKGKEKKNPNIGVNKDEWQLRLGGGVRSLEYWYLDYQNIISIILIHQAGC